MKRTTTYKLLILFTLLTVILFPSCSSVKYVEDGKYLISDVKINMDKRSVSESKIKSNIIQKPNVKIFGYIGFNLGIYNMSGRDLSKWYNRWFRTIGEEPVIYDSNLAIRSVKQVKQSLNNLGYYDAQVSDTIVQTGKKRINHIYNINLGDAYLIKNYSYFTLDTIANDNVEAVKAIIKNDSITSLIKKNNNINVDVIENERVRIARNLRNQGYYNFSERLLRCYVDSSFNDKQVKLFLSMNSDFQDKTYLYTKYKIRNVIVKLQEPTKTTYIENDNEALLDTLLLDSKLFLSNGKPYLRPKVLNSAIQFNVGEFYSLDKLEKTYTQIQALKQFKYINIKFEEAALVSLDSTNYVDCLIDLRPLVNQSYMFAVDGTSSSGNFGGAAKLSYSHRNIFAGAESFSLAFTGLYEKENYKEGYSYNKVEFGAEARLVSPQFLMPFGGLSTFRKRYSPKTVFSLGYNFQDNYSFKGKTLTSSFGYSWKSGRCMSYNFNLLDIDFIEMRDVDTAFFESLRNETARNSFKSHMVVASSFAFMYTGHDNEGFSNFFRCQVESAGNLANLISKLGGFGLVKEYDDNGLEIGEHKEYWGIPYSQYLKTDIDYIYKYKFNRLSSIAGRFFVGIGFPYGNMKVMPYERMYYSGGANSLRAWQSRTLGPGSSVSVDNQNFANKVSDMKLEANIEYRFKLFGGFEGAIFLDAGNIWAINSVEKREGADFQIDRFYKEFAVGTGAGFRWDFTFFLLRFDMGAKVYDPSLEEKNRYVFLKSGYNKFQDLVFNFAIGYPF